MISIALLSHNVAANEGLDHESINFSLNGFSFNGEVERIVPADFDGDGLQDLLVGAKQNLSLYFQRSDEYTAPYNFEKADLQWQLPGNATAWDVDFAAGQAHGTQPHDQQSHNSVTTNRIIAIVDGKQIISWTTKKRTLPEPTILVDSLSGYLPAGGYPMNFVRDINGDRLNDLIIPGASELLILLQNNSGEYLEAIPVRSSFRVFSRLESQPDIADRGIGQAIRIPDLEIRDINSDGLSDLIAKTEELVEVFLAESDGRFVLTPNYVINLADIEEKIGEPDADNIDYSNLSGLLAYTYDFKLADVSGDEIEDLLLREGGKISLFAGTKDGMDFKKPKQILKSSGNVIGIDLRDEDGDGRKDLWIARLEDISLANIFLWLAISGSIDIEAFIYKNQGERFSSRPHRKVTVTMKFPALLRSAMLVMENVDAMKTNTPLRTAHANISANTDGRRDLLQLGENSIAVFLDVVSASEEQSSFMGVDGFNQDEDKYVIDLEPLIKDLALLANDDLQLIENRNQDTEIPLPKQEEDFLSGDLFPIELNKDGRDDVFVFTRRDESELSGYLLVSQ